MPMPTLTHPARTAVAIVATVSCLLVPNGVAAQGLEPHQQLARDLFQQLIEINTTHADGDTTVAAEAMAVRLRAAGFPADDLFVGGPAPKKGNLVVRYRGRTAGRKPILLLAHLDVVGANRADWSPDLDPFRFTEKDGFFYGRGTTDDKAMAAIFVATFLRMKQQGLVPDRDIVLALTADEEGGDQNGVRWLLANHRTRVDAEYGLNEGGGGQARAGRRIANTVQASEKVYVDYTLEATNKGGHSSMPQPENAIYELAAALTRVGAFAFPVTLNEVTRAYFTGMAGVEPGPAAADFKAVAQSGTPDPAVVARLSAVPLHNAMLRTTCVATMVTAGHALNALPQRASANINCRVLPGEDPQAVQRTLVGVIANPKLTLTPVEAAKPSPPSPLTPEIMQTIARITDQLWPGVPVIPFMSTGATDGLFFREAGIPIYGVSGLFGDMDDVRAHGRDERIGIREFFDGQEFLWRLVTTLSGVTPKP